MEVGIYVKCHFRGNPRGAGEAAAVIEYIDGTGKSHTRKQQIRIEHDTKNALNLKICITAMRILLKPCHITIYTACDYMGNGVGGEVAEGRLEESKRKAARQRGGLETILYADTDPHRSICRV